MGVRACGAFRGRCGPANALLGDRSNKDPHKTHGKKP
jgi:hypothetical protein